VGPQAGKRPASAHIQGRCRTNRYRSREALAAARRAGRGDRRAVAPAIPVQRGPEQLNPVVAPPGWRPQFFDYLYLGFTNATAFSPTDVMPLARWAKAVMTL